MAPWFAALRERLAFKVAPWVYVPRRHQRDEAFKDLAEIAYGSRDANWTSPRVLVSVALSHARMLLPDLERDRLRWAIVELASHVHDCEELLSPRSRRTVSEVRAALLSRVADSEAIRSERDA